MVTIEKGLLLKYLDGTLNEEEATSLYNWAQESPENKEYLLSMKEASMSARYKSPETKADTQREWDKFKKKTGLKEKQPQLLRAIINLAAAVILVAGGIYIFKEKNREANTAFDQDTPLIIETGIGQTAGATLPDGSVIKLNSLIMISLE